MSDPHRVKTLPLGDALDAGNLLFRAAVGCIRLPGPLALHVLRDRLTAKKIDPRKVTVADLQAILPELEETIRAVGDDESARASVEALRGLKG